MLRISIFIIFISIIVFFLVSKRKSYNSITSQSIHYFSRPQILTSVNSYNTIISPSAWKGNELLKEKSSWTYYFSKEDINEIDNALLYLKSINPTLDLEKITSKSFPLPLLISKIDIWRKELLHGKAFQLLKGLPVSSWSYDENSAVFFALGQHLGLAGAQDNGNKQLLGNVKDIGGNPNTDRQYKTNTAISWHCDAADFVGLLMIEDGVNGGVSKIISSVSVYNELLKLGDEGIKHIKRLTKNVVFDTRGSGGVNFVNIPSLRFYNGIVRTFYHQEYFRSHKQYPNSPGLDIELINALDAYDKILEDSNLSLPMVLEKGDIQLISNHYILHSRTAYKDLNEISFDNNGKEKKKRHLLRLWLSVEDELDDYKSKLLKEIDRIKILYNLVLAKLFN
jgi:hypothetical protein